MSWGYTLGDLSEKHFSAVFLGNLLASSLACKCLRKAGRFGKPLGSLEGFLGGNGA
jgi:hypothetical protein